MESNYAVNNIPEKHLSMGFGVDMNKLHVSSCVHHVRFFAGMKLMECGDYKIERPGLGSYPVCQDGFYCHLVVPIYILWRSYGLTN